MTSAYRLGPADACVMADLHGLGFERSWPEADMLGHIKTDIVLGIGEPLFGFLIIRAAKDQAELLTITIGPNHRRKGLARQLLESGEQRAARCGVEILFLEVAEDNAAAIALYRALGFIPFGRRPAYYKRANGREAALTFRKQLTLDALPGDV